MMNFFIDKLGNEGFDKVETVINIEENDQLTAEDLLESQEIDLFDEFPDNSSSRKIKSKTLQEINLENSYIIRNYKLLGEEKAEDSNADKLLEKSVINKGFEKNLSLPSEKNKRILKLERKKLQEKTKGKNWFDMPATELTDSIKTDFDLLKIRSVLDRKHMYKKNDITHTPKYFQVGRVIESSADFYSGRIPKSLRRRTMVDELLADADFKKYQKKKFKEIMDESRRKKLSKKNKK